MLSSGVYNVFLQHTFDSLSQLCGLGLNDFVCPACERLLGILSNDVSGCHIPSSGTPSNHSGLGGWT
jgi:hypothetical protein